MRIWISESRWAVGMDEKTLVKMIPSKMEENINKIENVTNTIMFFETRFQENDHTSLFLCISISFCSTLKSHESVGIYKEMIAKTILSENINKCQ